MGPLKGHTPYIIWKCNLPHDESKSRYSNLCEESVLHWLPRRYRKDTDIVVIPGSYVWL